jgi:hypothetical protein
MEKVGHRKIARAVPGTCCSILATVIESELLGLPVADAARTAGTMMLVKFGTLRDVQLVSSGGKNKYKHGDWDLLIEAGRWRVSFDGNVIGDDSPTDVIDSAWDALVGSQVIGFRLADTGTLKIGLANGAVLEVERSFLSERISEWTIFRRESWSLALEPDGEFVLEAKCHGQGYP